MRRQDVTSLKEHGFFRESEIRGRLTDVLPFLPFSPEEVEKAVRGFLASESKAFSQHPSFQNVELAWSPEARSSSTAFRVYRVFRV